MKKIFLIFALLLAVFTVLAQNNFFKLSEEKLSEEAFNTLENYFENAKNLISDEQDNGACRRRGWRGLPPVWVLSVSYGCGFAGQLASLFLNFTLRGDTHRVDYGVNFGLLKVEPFAKRFVRRE